MLKGHSASPQAARHSFSRNAVCWISHDADLTSTMLTCTTRLLVFHTRWPVLSNVRQCSHLKRRSHAWKRVTEGSGVVQASKKGSVWTAA